MRGALTNRSCRIRGKILRCTPKSEIVRETERGRIKSLYTYGVARATNNLIIANTNVDMFAGENMIKKLLTRERKKSRVLGSRHVQPASHEFRLLSVLHVIYRNDDLLNKMDCIIEVSQSISRIRFKCPLTVKRR